MTAALRLPAGITQTQSYTWVLREAFIEVLTPLFPGFTILRNNQLRIQKFQLPILGVYILPERMTPDGDLNAGDIRFINQAPIGFSVMIANNDPEVSEQKLDAAYWVLMNGLWCNAGLTNLVFSKTADNTRFEGISSGGRQMIYGNVGINNETPVAELRYEATAQFRTAWSPTITDDLDLIVVTAIPGGFDPTQTETIEVQYDLSATG